MNPLIITLRHGDAFREIAIEAGAAADAMAAMAWYGPTRFSVEEGVEVSPIEHLEKVLTNTIGDIGEGYMASAGVAAPPGTFRNNLLASITVQEEVV